MLHMFIKYALEWKTVFFMSLTSMLEDLKKAKGKPSSKRWNTYINVSLLIIMATAALDRLLHHVHVINIRCDSYKLSSLSHSLKCPL